MGLTLFMTTGLLCILTCAKLTKKIANPLTIYIAVWLFVVMLYQLRISGLQAELSSRTYLLLDIKMLVFSCGYLLCYLSPWRAWCKLHLKTGGQTQALKKSVSSLASSTDKNKYFEAKKSDFIVSERIVLILFAIWCACEIFEVIWCGGMPVFWKLSNIAKDYKDFGIPTLHGLLNSFGLVIISLSTLVFLHEKERKTKLRLATVIVACILFYLLIITRQVIASGIIQMAAIYLLVTDRHAKNPKKIIGKILVGLILGVIGFGVIGNFRTGFTGFLAVSRIKTSLPPIVVGIFWVYMYLTMVSGYFIDFYIGMGLVGVCLIAVIYGILGGLIQRKLEAKKGDKQILYMAIYIQIIVLSFFYNHLLYLPSSFQFVIVFSLFEILPKLPLENLSMKIIIDRVLELAGLVIFRIFWLFPLKKQVIFASFSGRRYGDNPKYISEELHRMHPEVRQIWVYRYRSQKAEYPDYLKLVRYNSLKMFFTYATSKVWVDSCVLPLWLYKRKRGQFFLQTWHGGLGFKKIELNLEHPTDKDLHRRTRHNSKMFDLMLADSDWTAQVFRSAFDYHGEIAKIGLPKDAATLSQDREQIKKKVREFYHLEPDTKIALYAPSLRDKPSKEIFGLDIQKLTESLRWKFQGDWKVIARLHPGNDAFQREMVKNIGAIDGRLYSDIQDLVGAADVIISDYSSIVFSGAMLSIPTFCLAIDEAEFKTHERSFCVKLRELPFSVANTNEELCTNISKFNLKTYKKSVEAYYREVGFVKPSHPSKVMVELILEKLK